MDDVGKSVIKMVKEHKLDPTKLKNDKELHVKLYSYLIERAGDEW